MRPVSGGTIRPVSGGTIRPRAAGETAGMRIAMAPRTPAAAPQGPALWTRTWLKAARVSARAIKPPSRVSSTRSRPRASRLRTRQRTAEAAKSKRPGTSPAKVRRRNRPSAPTRSHPPANFMAGVPETWSRNRAAPPPSPLLSPRGAGMVGAAAPGPRASAGSEGARWPGGRGAMRKPRIQASRPTAPKIPTRSHTPRRSNSMSLRPGSRLRTTGAAASGDARNSAPPAAT